MQQHFFNFNLFPRTDSPAIAPETFHVDGRSVPVLYIRNDRAKRYLLRVGRDGNVRVTIPRRGSHRQAREFVESKTRWLSAVLRRQHQLPKPNASWHLNDRIYCRGELTRIELVSANPIRLALGADIQIELPGGFSATGNLRPFVEAHLRAVATRELAARTLELAAIHGVAIGRIHVRAQTSRWGSCSTRGTLSLNWRLIQTPAVVQEYIILHELMHRREMNHSQKFWAHVAKVCPNYIESERWLNKFGRAIL